MDVFALTATLSLQADNFFSGLADAAEAMLQFAEDSVKIGASFDYGMSKVGAVTNANAEEMEELRKKALEAGASTKYTAEESANALYYMGLAGWDVYEAMDGLNPVLNLAAASGSDLARTSDIVTDAMTAFGLGAEETARFTDVLAATSTNANTTVDLMGETFKYIAPVAGAVGYSIEDMGLAIGLMANMSVKGTRAGTALRNIITRLASPTDELQSAMDELGVTAFDSYGKALPFIDVMKQLREKIGGMPEESKLSYSEIFAGKYGLAGFEAIINATEDDFNELKEAIDNSDGATQILSDRMQDNLQGSFTELNSAVQDFQIAISDKLTPTVREFVDFGKKSLRDFTDAFRKEGLDGAIEVFGKFVEDGSNMIQEKLPVFQEKGTKILDAISKGIEVASPTIGIVIGTLGDMVGKFLGDNAPTIVSTVSTVAKAMAPGVIAAFQGIFQGLAQALPDIWAGISSDFTGFIGGLLWQMEDSMPIVAHALEGLLGIESKSAHDARVAYEAELAASAQAAETFVDNVNNLEPAQLVATFDDQASGPIQYAREIFDDFLEYSGDSTDIYSYFTDDSSIRITEALAYINDILAYNGTNIETLSTFVDESSDPALQAIVRLQELSDMSQKDYKSFSEHSSEVPALVQTILEWLRQLEGEQGEISHTSSVHDVITRYITETDGNSDANTYAENQSKTNAEKKIEKLGGSGNYAIHARSMSDGTILRGATMFGWDAQGRPQIGGGEGPEAVVGVNSLNEQIRGAVRDGLSGIVGAIAQAIGGRNEQPVYVVLDTGELVGAIGGKMDAELGKIGDWKGGGRA